MDVRTGNGPRQETDDYDQNFHTVRTKLLLEPTENLEILLSGDFTSRDENCCTAVQTTVGSTAAILNALAGGQAVAAPSDDPFNRVAYSNHPTTQDIVDKEPVARNQLGHAVERRCDADAITASREWQAINGLDYDFSTADLLYRNANEDESFTGFDTFNQELRLTGSTSRIDWMVGAFYSDEELTRNGHCRLHYEPYVSTLVYQLLRRRDPNLPAPLPPVGAV